MPSNGAPQTSLTVRALLQGKEAGSIIGKGGDVIKSFRDDSGARINIAAGTAMERMLTVSGATDNVFQAFQLIMAKLDEQSDGRGDLALRMVVPASQCGSIIGKGGAKIKELREETGAAIQVAKEMLPNSTDRTATVTGTDQQIAHCVQLISYIMLESPPKGANIPYEPLANNGPSGGGPGGFGPGPGNFHGGGRNNGNFGGNYNGGNNFNRGDGPRDGPPGGRGRDFDNFGGNFGGRPGNFGGNFNNPGNFGANFNHFDGVTTHEMRIPNEQAGSVIGKGGSRIAEIRQNTGATVTISKMPEGDEDGPQERTITIKGHPEQVAMAVCMINNR